MLGQLPKTLEIRGKPFEIDTDYRNILQIIDALNDEELKDDEKVYVLLRRLFVDPDSLPVGVLEDAVRAAYDFIECGKHEEKKLPKVVDWEKDEQMIFAAVNKVAGQEVRGVPYMHWWTFLGLYQSVDREDLFSFVVSIRQKRAKGKKLEEYESEFLSANPELFCVDTGINRKKEAEDYLAALYAELTGGGDDS